MSTSGSSILTDFLVRVFVQFATFNKGAKISLDGGKATMDWIIVDGFKLSTIREQTVHWFHIVVFGDQVYIFSFIFIHPIVALPPSNDISAPLLNLANLTHTYKKILPQKARPALAHDLPKIRKPFDRLSKFRPIIDTKGTTH